MALAVIALAAASLYGTISLVGTALGPAPARTATPGQASQAVAVGGSPSASGSIAILPSGSAGSVGRVALRRALGQRPRRARRRRPGPFRMDLYRSGAFVRELTPIWCLSAAMQTSANIMDLGAGKQPDRTRARQLRLFHLSRSIAPAPDKAAEPEGWAAGYAARLREVQGDRRAEHQGRDQGGREGAPDDEPAGRPHGLARCTQLGHVGVHGDCRPGRRRPSTRSPPSTSRTSGGRATATSGATRASPTRSCRWASCPRTSSR